MVYQNWQMSGMFPSYTIPTKANKQERNGNGDDISFWVFSIDEICSFGLYLSMPLLLQRSKLAISQLRFNIIGKERPWQFHHNRNPAVPLLCCPTCSLSLSQPAYHHHHHHQRRRDRLVSKYHENSRSLPWTLKSGLIASSCTNSWLIASFPVRTASWCEEQAVHKQRVRTKFYLSNKKFNTPAYHREKSCQGFLLVGLYQPGCISKKIKFFWLQTKLCKQIGAICAHSLQEIANDLWRFFAGSSYSLHI